MNKAYYLLDTEQRDILLELIRMSRQANREYIVDMSTGREDNTPLKEVKEEDSKLEEIEAILSSAPENQSLL